MGKNHIQFRYLSILDSMPSAFSDGRNPEETSWWLPGKESRDNTLVFARSELMRRLLYGDIIILPRNQAFDSTAWFDAAPALTRLQEPLFLISLLADKVKHYDASDFVREVAGQFSNMNFYLSAWPGLSESQRKIIAGNLIHSGNFMTMLNGIEPQPAPYDSIFYEQQQSLQKVLYYLSIHPGSIRESPPASLSLWPRLNNGAIRQKLGASTDFLYNIPQRIKPGENINNRGILYKYIEEADEEVREILRELIDQQYHYTLAESVTKGSIDLSQGLDSHLTIDDIVPLSEIGDAQYDHSGVKLISVQTLEKIDPGLHSPLEWKDVVDVLNDSGFQVKLAILRHSLSTGDTNHIQDALTRHLDFLVEYLPGKIVKGSDSSSLEMNSFHGKLGEFLIKIIPNIPLPGAGIAGLLMEFTVKGVQTMKINKKQKTISNRIRDWLQKDPEKAKKNGGEKL